MECECVLAVLGKMVGIYTVETKIYLEGVKKMSKEKENEILDAVDVVCLNCVEDTLNDNSVCKKCPVRKLCNSLEK